MLIGQPAVPGPYLAAVDKTSAGYVSQRQGTIRSGEGWRVEGVYVAGTPTSAADTTAIVRRSSLRATGVILKNLSETIGKSGEGFVCLESFYSAHE